MWSYEIRAKNCEKRIPKLENRAQCATGKYNIPEFKMKDVGRKYILFLFSIIIYLETRIKTLIYVVFHYSRASAIKIKSLPYVMLSGGGGGGGLTQKCRTCMGWGGVFGTQNTKVTCTLLYNKGGVSIFYPKSQKYKWYFCTHIS